MLLYLHVETSTFIVKTTVWADYDDNNAISNLMYHHYIIIIQLLECDINAIIIINYTKENQSAIVTPDGGQSA